MLGSQCLGCLGGCAQRRSLGLCILRLRLRILRLGLRALRLRLCCLKLLSQLILFRPKLPHFIAQPQQIFVVLPQLRQLGIFGLGLICFCLFRGGAQILQFLAIGAELG